MLGHAEFSWSLDRWEICPTRLVALPGLPGWGALTGSRTRDMVKATRQLNDDGSVLPALAEVRRQQDGPSVILVCGASRSDLQDIGSSLRVDIAEDVSEMLSSQLPKLDDHLRMATRAAPPARDSMRFGPDHRWVSWDGHPVAGLYRQSVYGRHVYRFATDDLDWVALDRGLGVYAELSRLKQSVILWEAEAVGGRLYTPGRIGLPALHSRAAVLCTGLLPG